MSSHQSQEVVIQDYKKPFISVIIPTKNSQNRIEKCLSSLVNQTYSNYEIIIVDGHSKDDTVKLASKFPVSIFFEDGGTRAYACNVGISKAKGEIVAFTDDDCVVPNNWLEQIAKNFENPEIHMIGGPSVTPPESTSLEKSFGTIYDHVIPLMSLGDKTGKIITGCNSAYRKKAVDAAGGFNEELITTEETDLQYRIYRNGGKAFFDQNMFVVHHRRANFHSFFKQFYRYGLGKGSMLRKHPQTLAVSNVIAFLPFLYLPFPLIILFFNQFLGLYLLIIPILLILIAMLTLSIIVRIKEKVPFHLIFTALILYVSGESLGHFIGILRKK